MNQHFTKEKTLLTSNQGNVSSNQNEVPFLTHKFGETKLRGVHLEVGTPVRRTMLVSTKVEDDTLSSHQRGPSIYTQEGPLLLCEWQQKL